MPTRIRKIIADEQNNLLVSSVSAFEITTKFRLGKLPTAALLVHDLASYLERAGFQELPLTIAHAVRAGLLPHPHRDPFDRLLAAQAMVDGIPIISNDPAFDGFQIERIE
jgi:PIN domain nuclease of toxin-antitoxin system